MNQQAFWGQRPFSFRELPKPYWPEARAQKEGIGALSDVELVVLLIGETKKESAQDFAGRILSLDERLDRITVAELTRIIGSRKKAVRFIAALELGRRFAKRQAWAKVTVKDPESAALFLKPHFQGLDRECFLALLLNAKNGVLAVETVSVGILNSSLVHPRELFKAAIAHSAAGIVIAHNHPSGDPTPSPEDILLTKRLMEAGKLMGIEIIDHVVVGGGRWVSLKEEGLI